MKTTKLLREISRLLEVEIFLLQEQKRKRGTMEVSYLQTTQLIKNSINLKAAVSNTSPLVSRTVERYISFDSKPSNATVWKVPTSSKTCGLPTSQTCQDFNVAFNSMHLACKRENRMRIWNCPNNIWFIFTKGSAAEGNLQDCGAYLRQLMFWGLLAWRWRDAETPSSMPYIFSHNLPVAFNSLLTLHLFHMGTKTSFKELSAIPVWTCLLLLKSSHHLWIVFPAKFAMPST